MDAIVAVVQTKTDHNLLFAMLQLCDMITTSYPKTEEINATQRRLVDLLHSYSNIQSHTHIHTYKLNGAINVLAAPDIRHIYQLNCVYDTRASIDTDQYSIYIAKTIYFHVVFGIRRHQPLDHQILLNWLFWLIILLRHEYNAFGRISKLARKKKQTDNKKKTLVRASSAATLGAFLFLFQIHLYENNLHSKS